MKAPAAVVDLWTSSKPVREKFRNEVRRPVTSDVVRFGVVLDEERGQIQRRRVRAECAKVEAKGVPPNLAGLALSGGGIRSATFCLGFLQALSERGALRLFDYLSTVSGGGFTGGWWSAWLARKDPTAPAFPTDEAIEPAREEEYIGGIAADMGGQSTGHPAVDPQLDPIHHLRLFSNYLTPRKGLLSADTWRAVAVVSRNLGLTWLVLLPVLLAATLLAQMYFLASPAGAYGFACVSRPDTTAASAGAATPAICLSITDQMPSALRDSVTAKGYSSVLRDRMVMMSKPLAIIVGLITAAGLAWLLVGSANLQNMIGTLVALTIVVTALVSALDRLALWKGSEAPDGTWGWVGITIAAGSVAILCLWWLVPTFRDPKFLLGRGQQDRRDTQSNQATRLQSMLLIGLACSAAVLGIGGFGHEAFSYLFTTREGSPLSEALRRAGGWGALLATIGSAVATAIYASPAGGGEKSRDAPTVPVALLLAVAPTLVIVVLAIGAATVAHWLLAHLLSYSSAPSKMSVLLPLLAPAIPGLLWAWREINAEATRLKRAARAAGVLMLTVAIGLGGQRVMALRSSLDPLDAALLLSLTVCALLTGFEYYTDAGRNSRAARWVIAIAASVVAVAATHFLSPMLLGTLERVHEGWLTEPPPGMRRPAGVFVGMIVGFTIARLCVTWISRGDAPAVLMLRHRTAGNDPSGRWIWIDLAIATLIGGGLGWLVSGMYISPDARPIAGVPWTVGSPVLAFLCVLGLSFSSAFVLLDLVCSRQESRRAIVLQFIVVALLGPTLMEQFLNPYGASVVLASGAISWIGICLGLVAGLGWLIDPNTVSLHEFYRARLVRAYLGATNGARRRRGERVTDSVAGDDMPLHQLANCEVGGPYHLINTTLNLVGGRDLATAQRSAGGFVLSQAYCGSLRTGFRETKRYMRGKLSLGTAMATSGAAASPNMGSKTPSAAMAMLLAFLNIRLGFWAPTPNQARWRSPQARLWPYYLLRESLSQTNDLSDYCYLTDGGHFDNTGLYSLVERGCRYIVMLDCGADPKPCFADLGDALRRCRIDFGTEVTLDIGNFVKTKGSGKLDRPHYVVGTILYGEDHVRRLNWPETSLEDRLGIIVWVKPALRAPDPADVRQYGLENQEFPQQSTGDQWFGESQWESYRRLGEVCGTDVLGSSKPHPLCSPDVVAEFFRDIEREFKSRLEAGKKVEPVSPSVAGAPEGPPMAGQSEWEGLASPYADLQRLASLRDKGTLTEKEFTAAKREVLGL